MNTEHTTPAARHGRAGSWMALLAITISAWPALAQDRASVAPPSSPTSSATPADPLDPRAPVPALRHRSVTRDYRVPDLDAPDPSQAWVRAHARVGEVGGWQAYAREAQGAAPASAAHPDPGVPARTPEKAPTQAKPGQGERRGHHHGGGHGQHH